jgi:hypothetical protein
MALRKRTKVTHNRGTQLVRVPVRIHNFASVLIWQAFHEKGEILLEGSAKPGPLTRRHLGDEAMRIVRKFLALDPEDENSVLQFLVYYGEFRSPVTVERNWPKGYANVVLEVIPLQAFKGLQDYVRRMLSTGNATLPSPWPRIFGHPEYKIFFGDAKGASEAHVWVDGVYPSMIATIQFKLLQGSVFRTCARKDCRLPFEVTSRHTRRFCTQYCAHITSVRQRRRLERKTKRQG